MTELKGKILAGKILVKPEAAEEKTASGIIIPESSQKRSLKGTVILVGDSKKDDPMEVSKGDTVNYGEYSGTELNLEEGVFLLMNQSDVLFIK